MTTTLGEICILEYGSSLPTQARVPGKYPVYGSNGIVGYHDSPLIQSRGLIVGRKGSIGAVHLAEHPFWPIDTTYFVQPRKGIELDFLFFMLKFLPLASLNRAAAVPGLNREDAYGLSVELPDLPTQRRLAARLKTQMAAVEQVRQLASDSVKTLQPLLDKTIAESFHGIKPLSLGRDESPAPKGWKWHLLEDLARLATGHTPSRRCPEYWADGDIPWMALPDIRALDCRVATTTGEKTNALGIANSSARVLPPGTVALSRTASVGFVTIFGREMATSQDFVNWVCGPDLHPSFLMWLLRAARTFIKGVSTGAVHQTVYMDVVERFRVCVPDLTEQKKLAARLDEAFRLTLQLQSAHEAQLEALDKLPGAYLREAFGTLS